ncbi:hypothetical protein TNCV_3790581 [Trichonephila clavipes]|nr:hypothetical protein TNCV_3790581 [Trichonephila clavipes]
MTQSLLAADLVILNLCQVTKTSFELASPLQTVTPPQLESQQISRATTPLQGGSLVALGFDIMKNRPRVREHDQLGYCGYLGVGEFKVPFCKCNGRGSRVV